MALNILLWIVIGFVTGTMARKVMPGPAAGGIFVAILIGVIGATVGGVVGTIFLENTGEQSNACALLIAASGALYPLFLYRCIAMRSLSPFQLTSESRNHSTRVRVSVIHTSGRPTVVPSKAVAVGASE